MEIAHPDRRQRLDELRAVGVDPYPARVPTAPRSLAAALLADADALQGQTVHVLGRILGRRGYGKLAFLDLYDPSGKIQVCLQKDKLSEADFALLGSLNRGDLIAVGGEFGRTKLGEPTVFGTSCVLMSKALLDPPEKWHGLADDELRARLRYVDLFTQPEVRATFLKRIAMIQAMREVFLRHCYVEVETPVLHPIYGGANARPFVTKHNALDMDLFLRIAPELYLKRLLVGGIERVFEFARVFRNEGVSPRHNPEFTMVEFYEAWTDVNGMMERTEELVTAAAIAAETPCDDAGRRVAEFRGERYVLETPYPRVRWADAFRKHVGCDALDRDAVRAKLKSEGITPAAEDGYGWWSAVNELFERYAEPQLRGPIFVHDFPAAICPLAKPSPTDPVWAERFEFFLGGMELANAFSELNDPLLQLEKFEEQVASKDPEAPNQVDMDYVRALAYGMPPAGGCGIGVDRLAMVLLGKDTIREVLLFPHLRPE
ncbi:MAG: lysine--tRNA ligase [Planctomycetota bacterium]|nr:lysine--tRNA ligase [Planctomycetota bacterium]